MPTVAGKAVVPFEGDFSGLASGAANAAGSIGDGFKKGIIAPVALVGAAVLGIGVVAVEMATKFQTSTTQLVTGAGESQKAIGMVRQGMLDMAGQVGISALDLSKGMYMIESAGFHGAAGLTLLKVAAEGAKVGGADLATVANALTSALNAYHLPASSAVAVTNELIATVSVGKMHMEDLASSMSKVVPIAASLGIPFAQVGGAIATMTMQGTDAAVATTSLRFMLAALAGPTAAAASELKGLGIGEAQIPGITSSVSAELKKLGLHTSEVAAVLASPAGLPGALKMITTAIGKEFPVGSAAYDAALKTAVGGTRGFTAALELTGPSAKTYADDVAKIGAAAVHSGAAVTGFALVQKDFGFKLDAAKAAMGSFLIQLGTALLPLLSKLADWFTSTILPALSRFAGWFQSNLPSIMAAVGAVFAPMGVALGVMGTALGVVTSHLDIFGPLLAGVVVSFVLFKTTLAAVAAYNAIVTLLELMGTAFGLLGAEAGGASVGIGAMTIGVDGLAVGMVAVSWPVLAVIAAVAALVVVALLVITHFQTVKTVAANVWNAVVGFLQPVIKIIGAIVDVLKGPLTIAFNVIRTVVETEFKIVWAVISTIASILINIATIVIGGLINAFKQLAADCAVVFGNIFNWINTYIIKPISVLVGWITGALTAAWHAVSGVISAVLSAVGGWLQTYIIGPISVVVGWLNGALTGAWHAISSVAGGVLGAVGGFINTFIIGPIKAAIGFINTLMGLFASAASKAKTAAQQAYQAANPGLPMPAGLRDAGGPVVAGQNYLIGMNRQPEIFTPGASGFITPMGGGGGASVTQNNSFVLHGTDESMIATMRALLAQSHEQIARLAYARAGR